MNFKKENALNIAGEFNNHAREIEINICLEAGQNAKMYTSKLVHASCVALGKIGIPSLKPNHRDMCFIKLRFQVKLCVSRNCAIVQEIITKLLNHCMIYERKVV